MSSWPWTADDYLGYLRHVSPQVIAVIIGWVIFQRYFVTRSNQAAFIDYLVKALDELRADSLEYWSMSVAKENRESARILEGKIKGAVRNLTAELRSYSSRYAKKLDFNALMADVSEACTGGDFERVKRGADGSRYLVVVNSIHAVKWELMKHKL